jgi:hypothetical protein
MNPEPEKSAPVPAPPPPAAAAAEPLVDPKHLTPEEQMALFEKDLKENDWGHQPC